MAVSLLKPNIRKKGTLIIKGLLGNLDQVLRYSVVSIKTFTYRIARHLFSRPLKTSSPVFQNPETSKPILNVGAPKYGSPIFWTP